MRASCLLSGILAVDLQHAATMLARELEHHGERPFCWEAIGFWEVAFRSAKSLSVFCIFAARLSESSFAWIGRKRSDSEKRGTKTIKRASCLFYGKTIQTLFAEPKATPSAQLDAPTELWFRLIFSTYLGRSSDLSSWKNIPLTQR